MTKETDDIKSLIINLKEKDEKEIKEADKVTRLILEIRLELLAKIEKAIIKKYG